LIAVGLFDGNIELREIRTGARVRGWRGHLEAVRGVAFASDGRLVSGSNEGLVKKWDVETGAEVWSRDAGVGAVFGIAELPDGRLAVSGVSGTVWVLDGVSGSEVVFCRGHKAWVPVVVSLGVLGAGSFASGSADETIRVWASDGALVRVVEVGRGVLSLSLSPCGRIVAAGFGDGSVRLFRCPEWDQVWSVKTVHVNDVWSVTWSPDGRFLASGGEDKLVKILSAGTGAILKHLSGHSNWVFSVLFSPDGTKVLSCSGDKTVHVWRIFWRDERRVRAWVGGFEVDGRDWEMSEVCCEIVGRMKRLWEVEVV
jgi:WD40 repeat protein